MTEQFDLITIGGGSGGLAAAQRAAEYGATVALIEPAPLGGTCVNVGCVPKKITFNAASLAHALDDARDYGFDITVRGHDWAGFVARRTAYVQRLNGIYERNLAKKGITHIAARARFTGPHTVEAGGRVLTGRHIIVATGGRPSVPQIPGHELGYVSDDFFGLTSPAPAGGHRGLGLHRRRVRRRAARARLRGDAAGPPGQRAPPLRRVPAAGPAAGAGRGRHPLRRARHAGGARPRQGGAGTVDGRWPQPRALRRGVLGDRAGALRRRTWISPPPACAPTRRASSRPTSSR